MMNLACFRSAKAISSRVLLVERSSICLIYGFWERSAEIQSVPLIQGTMTKWPTPQQAKWEL